MVDKRIVVVIVIFIIGGLFIYSFANPISESEDNYGGSGDSNELVDRDKEDEDDKIDQDALEAIKMQLSNLNEEDYTEESWQLLQDLIKKAENAKNQEEFNKIISEIDLSVLDPKVEQVDNSTNENDTSTIPGESTTINKTGLNSLKALVNSLNRNDYTATSYKAVTDAMNLPESTQAQVNAKIKAIQNAIKNLQPKTSGIQTIDKTLLNNLKLELTKYNSTDYTTTSWQKVIEASSMAESTQAQVNAKVSALQSAINNLQFKNHTVSLNADNGTNIQSITVKHNEKVSQPAAPTKDGYQFLGWYLGNSLFNFNTAITNNITLTAHWQKRATIAKFGVAANEPASVQAIVNGTQIRYKGEMQEKSPLTYDDSTYYNYIRIKVTAPDALSEDEYNKIRLVYQGRTYGKEQFERNSVTGVTYFEILQPFSPNYGSSASNSLTTINFDVYWGYGATTTYTVTFDIIVHENGT